MVICNVGRQDMIYVRLITFNLLPTMWLNDATLWIFHIKNEALMIFSAPHIGISPKYLRWKYPLAMTNIAMENPHV